MFSCSKRNVMTLLSIVTTCQKQRHDAIEAVLHLPLKSHLSLPMYFRDISVHSGRIYVHKGYCMIEMAMFHDFMQPLIFLKIFFQT